MTERLIVVAYVCTFGVAVCAGFAVARLLIR